MIEVLIAIAIALLAWAIFKNLIAVVLFVILTWLIIRIIRNLGN